MMAKRIAGSSCAAAFFALAAAAAGGQAAPQAPAAPQTPGQPQDAPRSPSAAQPPASSDQVTLVGCVARGNDGGAGTTQFTLRNAMVGSGASAALGDARSGSPLPGAVGTSGSGAAAGVATGEPTGAAAGAQTGVSGSAATYSLTGLTESDLSPYVGQRVEVIGRMDRSAAGAPGGDARDGGGAPESRGAAGSRGGSTTNPDAPLPGAGPAGRDRDAEENRDSGRPTGARTPGSPVAGAPGSTTPAAGSTARQDDAAPRSDDQSSSRADGSQDARPANPQPSAGQSSTSSVMQQVRVMSVRPLGGGCQ
jgi:hypothetical protein